MLIMLRKVSRECKCARMTAPMHALSESKANAIPSTSRNGTARGNTSEGAFRSNNKLLGKIDTTIPEMRPNQPLAPMAARAVASATERCPAPRFCVITTLTPMLIMRNKRKKEAWTWFDKVKAATAAADSCEAIDSPMSPTVIPSTRSAKRGQVMARRLDRGLGVLT